MKTGAVGTGGGHKMNSLFQKIPSFTLHIVNDSSLNLVFFSIRRIIFVLINYAVLYILIGYLTFVHIYYPFL